jgi:cation-transporting ATPase 13A1
MSTNASVAVKGRVGFTPANDIKSATWVHVSAAKNAGKDQLSGFRARTAETKSVAILNQTFSVPQYEFEFQKLHYYFDQSANMFFRRKFPTRASVGAFLSCTGHSSSSSAVALDLWGANEFDIPIPSFMELYKVEAAA